MLNTYLAKSTLYISIYFETFRKIFSVQLLPGKQRCVRWISSEKFCWKDGKVIENMEKEIILSLFFEHLPLLDVWSTDHCPRSSLKSFWSLFTDRMEKFPDKSGTSKHQLQQTWHHGINPLLFNTANNETAKALSSLLPRFFTIVSHFPIYTFNNKFNSFLFASFEPIFAVLN